MPDHWVRLDAVCDEFSLSRSEAYREMAAGRLPFIQRGRTRLFDAEGRRRYASLLKAESASTGVERLVELVDADGRIDVTAIPDGTTMADLEAAKLIVAERRAVA